MGYYLLDHPNPHGPHFYSSRRKSFRVIVIHITAGLEDIDMIGRDASAEQTAQYAASTSRQVSWHGGSDSDSFLYLLPPEFTAWHASDYNSLSYGWEISKRDTTWSDEPDDWVEATLRNAADGLRPIAKRYGIPARLLTRAQVDAGMSGFTYHMWLDPSRRSDPGRDFPIGRFFELLKGDDDMPLNDADKKWIENAIAAGAKKAATEVMNRDGVPVPWDDKKNPTWKLKLALAHMWTWARRGGVDASKSRQAAEANQRTLIKIANSIKTMAAELPAASAEAVREEMKDLEVVLRYNLPEENTEPTE